MINSKTNTVKEGLEYQLQVLEQALNDPHLADSSACVTCYQLAEDCTCAVNRRMWWPLLHVVFNLRTVLGQ